jgi:leader peptidase (prepilin peptidase)/N-methyltransferase
VLPELEPLATTPGAYAFIALLGTLWGSFANVCIYRIPDERSVVTPGSHCSTCKTPIRWFDNVPLLSYLWLRGKCRHCKAAFSPRYLVVEALTGALFALAWWFAMADFTTPFGERLVHFAIMAAFCVVMIVIAFIDLDTREIPTIISYPSAVAFYALSLLWGRTWYEGLVGAAIGFALPLTIALLYKLVRKQEGIGAGDFTLLCAVGALLGWPGVLASLFGGSLIGCAIEIPKLARSRDGSIMKTELAFAPYLAAGAVLYMFASPWVVVTLR